MECLVEWRAEVEWLEDLIRRRCSSRYKHTCLVRPPVVVLVLVAVGWAWGCLRGWGRWGGRCRRAPVVSMLVPLPVVLQLPVGPDG